AQGSRTAATCAAGGGVPNSRLKASSSLAMTMASDTVAGRPRWSFSDMAASRALLLARRGTTHMSNNPALCVRARSGGRVYAVHVVQRVIDWVVRFDRPLPDPAEGSLFQCSPRCPIGRHDRHDDTGGLRMVRPDPRDHRGDQAWA